MARITVAERTQSLDTLRRWIPKGATIYTVLRAVSRSGMRREIGLLIIPPDDPKPLHMHHHAARALGLSIGKCDGVLVEGVGMDMGFDLVYRLSCQLFGDGYALRHEWI